MKRLLFATTLLSLLAAPVFAQTATQTPVTSVKPNTPFTIGWDEDASINGDAISYRWWCDGAIKKNFVAADLTLATTPNADGSTSISATVPGLPPGAHTCTVSAFTAAFPADAQSPGLSVPSGAPAPSPKNLHIFQIFVLPSGGSGSL